MFEKKVHFQNISSILTEFDSDKRYINFKDSYDRMWMNIVSAIKANPEWLHMDYEIEMLLLFTIVLISYLWTVVLVSVDSSHDAEI
jgi:hypothetical protein